MAALVVGTRRGVYHERLAGDFLGAIDAGGLVTVFAHYDATLNGSQVHTSGRWTTAPAHVSGTTTFTASGGVFESYMTGWVRAANAPERRTASRGNQPDARYPVFFEITGVTATTLAVRGDLESQVPNLEGEAVHYILIPPVAIDRTTGAIDTAPTRSGLVMEGTCHHRVRASGPFHFISGTDDCRRDPDSFAFQG